MGSWDKARREREDGRGVFMFRSQFPARRRANTGKRTPGRRSVTAHTSRTRALCLCRRKDSFSFTRATPKRLSLGKQSAKRLGRKVEVFSRLYWAIERSKLLGLTSRTFQSSAHAPLKHVVLIASLYTPPASRLPPPHPSLPPPRRVQEIKNR